MKHSKSVEPETSPDKYSKLQSEFSEIKKRDDLKFDITLRFGNMAVKHLIGVIEDFKELIASEIEQIFKFSEMEDQEEEQMKTSRKPKMPVRKNVPTNRNTEKGLLKEKHKVEEVPTAGAMSTIHPAHENFNMVFNIMLGIKKAVDSTFDIPLLHATDKDFHLKC